MSLCFAESLREYQENIENPDVPNEEKPDDGVAEPDTPTPPGQNNDPMQEIDPDAIWEPILISDISSMMTIVPMMCRLLTKIKLLS